MLKRVQKESTKVPEVADVIVVCGVGGCWLRKFARVGGTRGKKVRLSLALALYIFAGTASAATQADLNAALDHKQDALYEFKLSLETAAVDINTGTFDNSTCEIYSSCSAELSEPFCTLIMATPEAAGATRAGRSTRGTASSRPPRTLARATTL
ncbi:unnamed protein product [Bathycoccus prasinos]